jgi:hypothetical protein
MNHAITRRAGPLFGAWLLVVGVLAAFTPLIPPAAALDPTPGPSAVVDSPSPAPAPTISPDPSAGPSTDPGVSPEPSPIPSPTVGPDPSPSVAPLPTPVPSPSAQPSRPPGPGLHVEHSWIDTEDTTGAYGTAGALDSPLGGMDRFVVYRVRFQVVNAAESAVTLRPLLEAGSGSPSSTRSAASRSTRHPTKGGSSESGHRRSAPRTSGSPRAVIQPGNRSPGSRARA